MLIIKIGPGEHIERALKRFRNKVRKTQQLKQIRDNQEFTKKSKARRDQVAKAIYREQYFREKEL